MNQTIGNSLVIAACALLSAGCIAHKSVVYQDVERSRVEFESDAAARLFYETFSRNSGTPKHSEKTTTVAIPIIFTHEQKTVSGPNVKFNDAVAMCDSNKDGKITELEARIFANQR